MRVCALFVAVLIASCARTPVQPEPAAPAAPVVPERDIVAEIQAEASKDPSLLEVHPLTDENVIDLVESARQRSREGQADSAREQLERALAMQPEDPKLWQFMAELKVRQRDFGAAELHALKSFDLGPRVGELCLRNWYTVAAARTERGDVAGAQEARDRSEACRLRARPRW